MHGMTTMILFCIFHRVRNTMHLDTNASKPSPPPSLCASPSRTSHSSTFPCTPAVTLCRFRYSGEKFLPAAAKSPGRQAKTSGATIEREAREFFKAVSATPGVSCGAVCPGDVAMRTDPAAPTAAVARGEEVVIAEKNCRAILLGRGCDTEVFSFSFSNGLVLMKPSQIDLEEGAYSDQGKDPLRDDHNPMAAAAAAAAVGRRQQAPENIPSSCATGASTPPPRIKTEENVKTGPSSALSNDVKMEKDDEEEGTVDIEGGEMTSITVAAAAADLRGGGDSLWILPRTTVPAALTGTCVPFSTLVERKSAATAMDITPFTSTLEDAPVAGRATNGGHMFILPTPTTPTPTQIVSVAPSVIAYNAAAGPPPPWPAPSTAPTTSNTTASSTNRKIEGWSPGEGLSSLAGSKANRSTSTETSTPQVDEYIPQVDEYQPTTRWVAR